MVFLDLQWASVKATRYHHICSFYVLRGHMGYYSSPLAQIPYMMCLCANEVQN